MKREKEEKKDERPMEYVIGGITYIQKPLVLGQIKELTKALKDIKWPEKLDMFQIIESLSDILPKAAAIVLIEKEKNDFLSLKNRDTNAIAELLEYTLSTADIERIIDDFLSCNPIDFISTLVTNVIRSVYVPLAPQKTEEEQTGSTSTSSISREETSQEETAFSGDTP